MAAKSLLSKSMLCFMKFGLQSASLRKIFIPLISTETFLHLHPKRLVHKAEAQADSPKGDKEKVLKRINELSKENISEKVRVAGWLQFKRMAGQFLVLRDSYGSVQVVISDPLMIMSIKDLPLESVLEVEGIVMPRPKLKNNEFMETGEIEVLATGMSVLNQCKAHLPFPINEFFQAKEQLRLQYRYLDLRRPQLQHNLRMRSQVLFKMREFLASRDFVDVETPILFRKTPGGAREFKVPTHEEGKFFSLPQSPQQFKQLLMVGGIDRYMQVSKCFRDETAKPDRQPEFTQMDLEMSFVSQDDVKEVVEGMVKHSWPSHLPPIQPPFPRMDFTHAIKLYGSDKPDTRYRKHLQDVTDAFEACSFPVLKEAFLHRTTHSIQAVKFAHFAPYITKKDVKNLANILKSSFPPNYHVFFAIVPTKEDGSWNSSFGHLIGEQTCKQLCKQLEINVGDVFIVCAGIDRNACLTAGKFRTEMAELLKEKGITLTKEENSMNFLWVENFPLFLPKEDGTEGLESAHHPFTAPHPDDLDFIYAEPEKVRGQHYDLVLNGCEVAGGSIRIHQAALQQHVLVNILKEETGTLDHLIEALNYGAPPHGGIALGVDRYMSILCNTQSIRDVIAFPKSSEGKCLLSKAPSKISESDKQYYHLLKKTK